MHVSMDQDGPRLQGQPAQCSRGPPLPSSAAPQPPRPPPAASAQGCGHGEAQNLCLFCGNSQSCRTAQAGGRFSWDCRRTESADSGVAATHHRSPPSPPACLQRRFLGKGVLLQAGHHRSQLLVPLRCQVATQRRLARLHLPPGALAGGRPPRFLRSPAGAGAGGSTVSDVRAACLAGHTLRLSFGASQKFAAALLASQPLPAPSPAPATWLTSCCCFTASSSRCFCRSRAAFSPSHSARSAAARCSYSCAAWDSRAWSSRRAAQPGVQQHLGHLGWARAGVAGRIAGEQGWRLGRRARHSNHAGCAASKPQAAHPAAPTRVSTVQLHLVLRCKPHAQRL